VLDRLYDPNRRRFLGAAAMTLAAAPFGAFGSQVRLPIEGELPALHGATAWLNSEPLTKSDLHGKVALVDFWTYSCINWRRSVPYVRAWAKKYKDHGLVVIGSHSPEFGFEHDISKMNSGRRYILSMKKDASAITSAARETTISRKPSYRIS
jgi:thiol-disulfide isomerase/thioredoxin